MKVPDGKKRKEDKQTLADLSSAHCHCMQNISTYKPIVTFKTNQVFLTCHVMNILQQKRVGLYGKILTLVKILSIQTSCSVN